MATVSPASRGMASFPLPEVEVAGELSDDVTLPVVVEPEVTDDVLVVDMDPPQAFRAPTASAVSNRMLVALDLCPGMISPTMSRPFSSGSYVDRRHRAEPG
jgi:hypothetical protein